MARESCSRNSFSIEPTESESRGNVDAVFIRETPLPPRYVDLGLIAFGASGDVHRVRDTHLSRVLAMKIMHSEHIGSARKRARFIAEIELTADGDNAFGAFVHRLQLQIITRVERSRCRGACVGDNVSSTSRATCG